VPNSGNELDECGVCAGNGCSCLSIIVPPLVPGPCDPFYLILLARSPTTGTAHWTIVVAPTYGTAIINALTGALAYYPPSSMSGVGPFDIITVSVVITSCPLTCDDVESLSSSEASTDTDTETSSESASDDIDGGPGCSPQMTVTTTINLPMVFFVPDACGECGGPGTECVGCDGVPGSGLVLDGCGVCGGDGTSCAQTVFHKCDAICIGFILAIWLMVCLIVAIFCGLCKWCVLWCSCHDDDSCRQRTMEVDNPHRRIRKRPAPPAVDLDHPIVTEGWDDPYNPHTGSFFRNSRDRRGYWFRPGI